jgi:hypothetical protein
LDHRRRAQHNQRLAAVRSFDYVVCGKEQLLRLAQAKRFGGFQIYHQLELSWLLDRQIRGLGTSKDFLSTYVAQSLWMLR